MAAAPCPVASCGLTNHSSRRRSATRLNSGVWAMRVPIVLAMSVLLGCTANPPKPVLAVPATEAACNASSGAWLCRGLPGDGCRKACRIPTTDAGKTCRDSSECEGGCIAPSQSSRRGTCSAFNLYWGCQFYLDNIRKAGQLALCVD